MVQRDPVVSSDLIVRLYSVARGLEDEGQNNIAKLFRAAALGEMYRASQDRPRQGAGLEEAMQEAVADLVGSDTTSESFTQALSYAVQAFERGDWPLLTDIPKVHVCRFCGDVIVGEQPNHCPTCGARSLTLQESPPVFYLDSMSPEQVKKALRDNLTDIERSVEGFSEEDADRGVWPMRDILSHLVGAQDLMFGRAKRMLAEDNPNLGSVPPTEIGKGEKPASMAEMLDSFRQTRREVIEMFNSLSPEQLDRPGYHPEWGRLTVLSQITYMVRHEQSHLAELEARRNGQ
jgi:hypothetical protein